jgi:GDPmannose 4,6-dehydratase
MKKALITGINGQDGTYLSSFLLSKGYEVHGMIRRESASGSEYTTFGAQKNAPIMHYADLSDASRITSLISSIRPHEIYNLAAQSHVGASFQMPEYTGEITGLGVTRILEAIRTIDPSIKFYQASTSEMFGTAKPPQNELTRFHPCSPYAAAKMYAHWMTVNYRQAYGIFACSGILFNHESPLRGETFVTRKITKGIANLLKGSKTPLSLGNLDSHRDWGFAPEYVEAMWLMLQQETADDYVIGTGKSNTVRSFLETAFDYVGITLEWIGTGINQVGVATHTMGVYHGIKAGDIVVTINPAFFRPTEVDYLQADISKASTKLGWQPRVSFQELVSVMLDADIAAAGLLIPGHGVRMLQEKTFSYAISQHFEKQHVAQ